MTDLVLHEPAEEPSAMTAPGHATVVGDYRLQRRLGSGGAGEVWLGWHVRTDRPAAVKVPSSGLFCGEAGRRSAREWRAVAKLSHPNIVSLYDAGPTHLAMAYIDGSNLAQRLQSPLEPGAAILIARQIASALAHAHAHGVVHRDVKPANVMLDTRGTAYLTDFGLAIVAGESADGVVRGGTPGYMAPEQERERLVGPAADQYGLARTLLDMLIGSSAPTALDDALDAVPSDLREGFEPLLRRALAERPEDRWPTVSDFAGRLAAVDLGHATAPERLAEVRRSGEPYTWCSFPHSTAHVSPRIGTAEYTLVGLAEAGAISGEALARFTEETGYSDVGFTAYACTGRLGPLDRATVVSRASDLVVLLHGTANTRDVWRDVAIAICRDNAEALVLVPDVFGFGETTFAAPRPAAHFFASGALVRMTEGWLDVLSMREFPTVLVGHSAAAAELMGVTDEQLGDHVSRVALTPVFPFASRMLRIQLRLGALLLLILGRSRTLKKFFCWLLVAHGPATSAFSREERREMRDATEQVPWYVTSRFSTELARAQPAEGDRLERCAILVGKEDPIAPEQHVLEVLSELGVPTRNIYKMASGGHMPHLTEDANPGWRMRNIDNIVRVVDSMLLSSREGLPRHLSARSTLLESGSTLS